MTGAQIAASVRNQSTVIPRRSGKNAALDRGFVALMFFDRTKQGYRMRVFAANQDLSRQMGVRPRRTVFLLFLLAGAGAGFAGFLQVAGVDHRLYPSN